MLKPNLIKIKPSRYAGAHVGSLPALMAAGTSDRMSRRCKACVGALGKQVSAGLPNHRRTKEQGGSLLTAGMTASR